jgi:hypothetical protein
MFRHLFSHSRKSPSTSRRQVSSCRQARTWSWRPHVEELESRFVPTNVGITHGTLVVDCDGENREVSIDRFHSPSFGDFTTVNVSGWATTWAESGFSNILITTVRSGNDIIRLKRNTKPVEIDLGNNGFALVGDYGNLDYIQGFVNVGGLGFGDRLAVEDSGNQRAETWQLGSGDSSHGFVSRAGAATIVFSGLGNGLIVYGTAATSSYDVAQTFGYRTTLYLFTAGTANVRATTGELDVGCLVEGGVVNVGNGGSLQNIRGPVNVYATTLTIDDQFDPNLRSLTVDNFGQGVDEFARFTGLAPNGVPISAHCASTSNITVRTGSGKVVTDVVSTAPLGPNGAGVLTLEGHSPETYVSVLSNDHTVRGIRGTLRITNSRAYTGLYVYDSSDTVQQTFSLDSVIIGDGLYGQITGLARGAIQYRYNQTTYLSVYTGPGGANINLTGTGVDTYLEVAGSNDSVVLLGSARGLQGLQGQVTISSHTGRVNVDVNDVADTQNPTVTLDTFTPDIEYVEVFGLTPRPVTIQSDCIARLDVEGGSGSTLQVQNTSKYSFPTTIYTNFGNNTVNVHATSQSPLSVYLSGGDTAKIGDANNGLANIRTPVNVVGNALGAGDAINVIDQANPNTETYTVTDTDLSTSKGQIVTFQDFDTLVLFPSLDAATTITDTHDPNLYTLNISYDPPPAPPPAGRGVPRAPIAQTVSIDGTSVDLLAKVAREGPTASGNPPPITDAMLADLVSDADNNSSCPPLAVELALTDLLPSLTAHSA